MSQKIIKSYGNLRICLVNIDEYLYKIGNKIF